MRGTSPKIVIMMLFAIIFAVCVLDVEGVFLPKRANGYSGRDMILDPKKRPFCNAFTGCGRKRSNLPPLTHLNSNHFGGESSNSEETIGSLLELSAEPAVEDLSRQIMSEAKLWEAIQEANVELLRRKQASIESGALGGGAGAGGVDDEPATPARSATASCALPPCYI